MTGSDATGGRRGVGGRPVLSVLTVAGAEAAMLSSHASLVAQSVDSWEWIVVADPSWPVTAAAVAGDARVVHVEDSVGERDGKAFAAGLDRALRAASGEHVLVLGPGDRLAREAVFWLREGLPPQVWGYSDEVQTFGPGRSDDVWLKPDHSPERLRAQPYPVRSAFLPRTALLDDGGFRAEAATAAVYDAVLRLSETGPGLRVPHPLVFRTDLDTRQRFVEGDAGDHARAVAEHCQRVGIDVSSVEPVVVQGRVVGQRVRRRLARTPSVSVVIPTRGSSSVIGGRSRCHVVELLRSLWVPSRYPDLEVVVVHDRETPDEVLAALRDIVGDDDLVLVPYEGEFHFSRKCNLGALAARGEQLCFLNDDTEIRSADWLHEMVGLLADPGVGGVGARLLFADGTLQHMGHSYSSGDAGHPLFGWWPTTLELGAAAQVTGERVGVTAACLLVRTSDFLAVGGFSENLPLNYNDVDLCLKLREAGFRLVYTPHAELYHFESQTRVARVLDSEVRQVRKRWATRMKADPYLRLHRGHRPRARIGRPAPLPSIATEDGTTVSEHTTTVETALPLTGGET